MRGTDPIYHLNSLNRQLALMPMKTTASPYTLKLLELLLTKLSNHIAELSQDDMPSSVG